MLNENYDGSSSNKGQGFVVLRHSAPLPASLPPSLCQAYDMGKKVGVVSTAHITYANPAGLYSRTVDRDFEFSVPEGCTEQMDIASQVGWGATSEALPRKA